MVKTHCIKEEIVIRPKVERNVGIAGFLLTDADTVLKKLERCKEGILRGLYVFEKEIPTGIVYIANGVEFPTPEAVDLILYFIWLLEKQNWDRVLRIVSIRKLLKEVFGRDNPGKDWIKKLERFLVIWKNHSYYFPNSFIWQGQKVTAHFGVICDWKIIPQGKGKPSILEIEFDRHFIKLFKETNWYRRPSWMEIRKLRKEIAKSLYLLAFEYKPSETSTNWTIYMDKDLKYWYRNALNSVANPKHLRPSRIVKRIENAIEEINHETNIRMKLCKTEEGNYAISVEEVALPGSEKIEIPFDKLSDEDKAILIAYVESVAEEKKIKNIWGFLRSMTSKQVEKWLKEAKVYFENLSGNDKETELVEKPRLLEILRDWGRKKLEGKNFLYKTYFGEDKVLKAYENNKKVVFKCVDRIMADLLAKMYGKELKEVFRKEVIFEEI